MNLQRNKYLTDILTSISLINTFLGNNKSFAHYDSNQLLQAAVERHIEIIGEATRHLILMDENIVISNARKIVNTRNKIAHGYDEIDNAEIWNIIINHLSVLNSEIKALLSEG